MEKLVYQLRVYRDLYLGRNTYLTRAYIGTYHGSRSYSIADEEAALLKIENQISAEGFSLGKLDHFCEILMDTPDIEITPSLVYDLI
jgi:hypothetical protein